MCQNVCVLHTQYEANGVTCSMCSLPITRDKNFARILDLKKYKEFEIPECFGAKT